MFKKLLYTILVCLVCFEVQAQLYYNQRPDFLNANKVWAFPTYAGVDFNNGNRIGIETAMNNNPFSNEGAASVCDPLTGTLLFYWTNPSGAPGV